MIQKTYLFETKVGGLNAGVGKLTFGTLSVLKGKTIRSVMPEERTSFTGASLDGADLVDDNYYGAVMLKLVNSENQTVVDHVRLSTLRKAYQESGNLDQFNLKNIDWEKSELVIKALAGSADQTGNVIALQIVYND